MVPLLLIATAADLLIGALVLKSDSKSVQNRYFAAFVFASAVWAVGDALMLFADQPVLAALGAYLFIIAPLYTTLFVVLFARVFPRNTTSRRTAVLLSPLAVMLSLAAVINIDHFVRSIEIMNPLNRLTPAWPGYFIYSLYFGIYLSYALWLLARQYRRHSGHERAQLGYTFTGIALASVTSMVTNLTLPNIGNMRFVWVGAFSTGIAAGIISIAIIKHRLFDIRLFVARSIAYVFSIGVLLVGYTLLSYVLATRIFPQDVGRGVTSVADVVLIIIAAASFGTVKKFFDKITNRLFYRDAYDPQAFIDELNTILVSNIELKKLLEQSTKLIEANLKSEFCLFSINETDMTGNRFIGNNRHIGEKQAAQIRSATQLIAEKIIITEELDRSPAGLRAILSSGNIAVLIKMVSSTDEDGHGTGYILLGPKKSGNPYNRDDIRILDIIANELVIAIQNTLRFEEIEKFSQTLQERVDSATRQLRSTNEKLKQMDETKDEFISMASHQLRTPLTSVKGYLSMVLEGDAGELNEMQRKLLDQAFASSQRMVYLIADLLNVSRLKTGKFIIEKAPCNLADVVEGEIDQLRETAAGRSLKLLYDKPKKFPTLMLDETKIRQVIMNFTDNAIYYTPAGGTIKVNLKETEHSVEFTVVDNGLGVPKGEQHQLFNKFYRAANAKKARPDGTGLGLFMAKKIVVAQDGSIIFKSVENQGSTFGFSFSKIKLAVPEHLAPTTI